MDLSDKAYDKMSELAQPTIPDHIPSPLQECCKCAAYREIIAEQAVEMARMRKESEDALVHTKAIARYLNRSLGINP